MINECFYITGRGGSIHQGLGAFLKSRSHQVTGISLAHDFLQAPFEQQLSSIQSEFSRLQQHNIPVIANSYGAYLFLNSLIGVAALQTKVLLLSPVVGTLVSKIGYFKPPYEGRIPAALCDGTLRKPAQLDICCGSLDNQCDLAALATLAKTLHADRYSILDGQGHMIDKHVVAEVVDTFLSQG
jgi:hypothetical protein